jgi:lysophospholipase L1-like esterase
VAVKRLAEKHGQRYIDLNGPLTDEQGRLKAKYTIEGIHINHEGYRSIFGALMRYALEG